MWIRIQSKEAITKIIAVTLDTTKNGVYTIRGFNENSSITHMYLGSYSTKEKAMKVLDMIHTFLNTNCIKKVEDTSTVYREITTRCNVFQMPQDNEV